MADSAAAGGSEDSGESTRSFSAEETASLLGADSPEPPRPARVAPAAPSEAWAELARVALPSGDENEDERTRRAPVPRRTGPISGEVADYRQPAPHHPVTHYTERPLNPSLQHTRDWITRAFAVLVLLIAVLVVVLLINSGGH